MHKKKESKIPNSPKEKKSSKNNEIPFIVAIGSSAGGLKALEAFFKNTTPGKNIAFVVIQHLAPNHDSMLAEILQRSTDMEVIQVNKETGVEADTVYVIPPGNDMLIKDNHLILNRQKNPRGVRLPVDYFFSSLKDSHREKAIGIILSGTGSDGTLGLKDIKSENGMIMVQKPATAEHRAMPENAIDTGLVDFVLPPGKMFPKIVEFLENAINKPYNHKEKDSEKVEKQVNSILKIIKEKTKHDFDDYKKSTIFRRIEKRINVKGFRSFDEYINLLEKNPGEAESLFQEFLIGVTRFFRDKEVFNYVSSEIIPALFKGKDGGLIRVWVPGCSTGEEAYTIAMLVQDFKRNNKKSNEVQIFASDIDEKALEQARRGKYPLNIAADVPENYLNHYFSKSQDYYHISKEIRDMVIYAKHNVLIDPPYSRLELVSCRNLLIYLNTESQERIRNIFHYSLNKDGFLLLGSSETTGTSKDLFNSIHSQHKVFQKIKNANRSREVWPYSGKNMTYHGTRDKHGKKEGEMSLRDFAENEVREKYTYPFLIVNKAGEIQFSLGNIKKFFHFPVGEPNTNVLNMASESIKVPLANALRRIKMEKQAVVYENIRFEDDEQDELLKITVSPIKRPAYFNDLFIVLLETIKTIKYANKKEEVEDFVDVENQDEYVKSIEKELDETRDYLQSLIQELETSNEELKASNEEAQSSNEELQSTNEELETSKEELQSLNEELETSNNELQRKIEEVSAANNDINNFISSSKIGVIFLDKHLCIQMFTPSMQKIIHIIDSDIGRSIGNFVTNLRYDSLVGDAKKVLETLVPIETEVSLENGGNYWMRILPYRTMEDTIEGIVITFTDITELKKSEELARQNRERFKTLFDNMNSGVAVMEVLWDENGNASDAIFIDVNKAYKKQTGISRDKVLGKKMSKVFPNFRMDLFNKLTGVTKSNKPFESVEYVPQFDRYYKISAYSFEENRYVSIFEDITKQVKIQENISENEEKFRGLFFNMEAGIAINRLNITGKKLRPSIVIEKTNPAFEKITGLKDEQVSGQDLLKVFTDVGIIHTDNELVFYDDGTKFQTDLYWEKNKKHLRLSTFSIRTAQAVMVIRDITSEKEELVSKHHLASIVEYSEDAIYSISLGGEIISWNKGAQLFYGYEAGETIGKNVAILSDKDPGIHDKLIAKVRSGEVVKNFELEQKTKNGQILVVSLTKSPIKNKEGEIIAISNVAKDISRIKERENELVEARKKSEQATRLKTSFLQNISHEIRTPMNSIIGFTDILKKRLSDLEDRKYMNAIDSSGKQLIHLIDDMLDLSRIETGELSISKSSFNLDQLMDQIKSQFEGLKKNKQKEHIELCLAHPRDHAVKSLYSDKYRVQQILSNLLSNAIKYTDKGYIEFGYQLIKDKNHLLFHVRDTGKGIKKSHLQKIFERFERIDDDVNNIFSGSGLGLAISKSLAELLGGEIWCESEEGKGSAFFFTLPRVVHDLPEDEHDEIHYNESAPVLQGKTILIAEDDEYSYQMMNVILSATGAKILHAKDGELAIKLFNENEVDIMLCDIRLPKKDGHEVLKAIKSKDKGVPVIAQTAYAMPEERKKIMDNGFDGYIDKPVTSGKIYGIINKFIENKNQ